MHALTVPENTLVLLLIFSRRYEKFVSSLHTFVSVFMSLSSRQDSLKEGEVSQCGIYGTASVRLVCFGYLIQSADRKGGL